MGGDSGSITQGGGRLGRRNVALEEQGGAEERGEEEHPAVVGAGAGEHVDEDDAGKKP